jgi:hypothetical protein
LISSWVRCVRGWANKGEVLRRSATRLVVNFEEETRLARIQPSCCGWSRHEHYHAARQSGWPGSPGGQAVRVASRFRGSRRYRP